VALPFFVLALYVEAQQLSKSDYVCLELSKIKALKMRDLQTKSAIDSTDPLVLI